MPPLDRAIDAATTRSLLHRAASAICATVLALTFACSPGGDDGGATVEPRSHGADARKAPSAESRLGDAILHFEVKARLLDALHWDAVGIEVDADDGRVVLRGEVPSSATRKKAEEIARSVEGVEQTECLLVLATEGEEEGEGEASRRAKATGTVSETQSRVRDALIEARLKAQLLQRMGRHGLDIQVEALDGVVTLRGRFENEAYEQTTLETASATPGVKRLVNLIET